MASTNDYEDSPSPPPPSSSSSSPPPPQSSSSSSPPPLPSSDSKAPPPSGDSSSPPPPNSQSSPPPPDSSKNKSPPPPSPSSNSSPSQGGNGGSPPPPPPPPPPPHSGSHAPPRSRLSPPPPPSSSSHDGNSSSQKALIAGVAAGAGLLLLIMIVFLISCSKRKKRKPHDQMLYYRDNSRGRSDYYGSEPQWHNPQSHEHVLKMPPSGAVSSEHGWPIAPPPLPPMRSSSDMSSAAFSGPHNPPLPPPYPGIALGFNQSSFIYDDLAAATGGFSRNNLLGQGGFGYVHKGVLPNGKEIAVKSLKSNSGQGEREFQAEVDIISRVHHRHLVSLVGYCIAGSQRMLVYEFVSNNTLEYHLHGKGRPVMDWPRRLKIAMGSAKGFSYLHEDCHPRIIHRDIKASNILLDENFEAKVADFGLAKLSNDTNTHVSTRIMGTFGYLAPEYASTGKLTEKSDVYSYGIMLLELITGRRPVDINMDDDSLADWARPILTQVVDGGSFVELVDPRLEDNYDKTEMLRMVACASACIRHSARRRPKMSQIVRALEGDVSFDDLSEGVKPRHSALFGSSGGSFEMDSGLYQTDLKKLMKTTGLTSQDFTSGDHGLTGDYSHSSGESQEIGPNRSRGQTP